MRAAFSVSIRVSAHVDDSMLTILALYHSYSGGDAPLTNIYAKDYSLLDWAKKVGGSRGEFHSPLFLPICAYMLRSNTFADFEPGRVGWVAG